VVLNYGHQGSYPEFSSVKWLESESGNSAIGGCGAGVGKGKGKGKGEGGGAGGTDTDCVLGL
jgi:hypothetical protein